MMLLRFIVALGSIPTKPSIPTLEGALIGCAPVNRPVFRTEQFRACNHNHALV